jgi:hypothetical protein
MRFLAVFLLFGISGASPALSDRLLRAGELAGFTPEKPSIVKSADAWADKCPPGDAKRLRSIGFIAGASEHLRSKLKGRDAISLVSQFRTRSGAQTDVVYNIAVHLRCSTATFTAFAVPEIPGAHGIAAKQPDGMGYDVVFTDGVYSYDIGAFTADPKGPPTASDVAVAARKLYRRVHR